MYGSLIYISSLEHSDVKDKFVSTLEKEKYACFPVPNIKNIGKNLYILAMPFNKKIHWFMAGVTASDDKNATLNIIDKHVLAGNPVSRIITLSFNEKGILDNTEYCFSDDLFRENNDIKMINAIRKNSMGDYDFSYSHENAFKITPRKSRAFF